MKAFKPLLILLPAALALASCGERGGAAGVGRHRPAPRAAGARRDPDSDRERRVRPWVGRRALRRSPRTASASPCSPRGSIIRAGSTCCRTATCWSPRPTRRPSPDDGKGVKGWVMKQFMKRAGAGAPSANRITLLRDADGDGVAETRTVFLEGLNSPFGMALVGNDFYVANTDAVRALPLRRGRRRRSTPRRPKVVDLPAGPINHHWTKNLIASRDGTQLYVDRRLEQQRRRERHGGRGRPRRDLGDRPRAPASDRVFAIGPAQPERHGLGAATGALWTVVNERDELGSDLVPDYLTSVQRRRLLRLALQLLRPARRRRASSRSGPTWSPRRSSPDYALGPHTASLGLAFADGDDAARAVQRDGMFVGQHGSWNRKPRSGYKVIFVPFANGKPSGAPVDVLTGFLNADGEAHGPPGRRRDRQAAARCWSPTTSATSSGASLRRKAPEMARRAPPAIRRFRSAWALLEVACSAADVGRAGLSGRGPWRSIATSAAS